MRDLFPGIRVFLGAADAHADRIRLSTGTRCAPASYWREAEAIIPSPPWRKPSPSEMAILISKPVPSDYGSAVSVISLPGPLFEPFEPLQAAATLGKSKDQINEMLAGSKFATPLKRVIRYVETEFQPSGKAGPGKLEGGIFAKDAAHSTVTTDPQTGKLVGLHVDNWSEHAIGKRVEAPNRITFNLGCEDRFFLFVNLPVQAMFETVRSLLRPIEHATAVGRVFMALFPDYPVTRLRIRPGEAYIAPTENVIHDGSTVEMSTADITLSLRGRIALCGRTNRFARGRNSKCSLT